jgi:flagellar biosynthetic protein FlhB
LADEDKKHDPTPNKIDEERKKGNLLKVQDAMVAAMLFVSAYALTFTGNLVYQWVHKFVVETIETIPEFQTLTFAQVLILLARAAIMVLITTAPITIILMLTAIVVMYAQVGWLITFKPLEPKFEKIDPIKGFKNKINPFKMKQAFNLLKTFAVMLIIGWLVFTTIRDNMGPILQSMSLTPAGAMALAGELLIQIAKKVAMAMLVIAFISYLFERWQWWKGMKMSDKEIKDEYKKLEGDPHIKGKQKQKMYEMAMGAAREAVPNADVIITNPTHFAVALEYKPHRGMKSPIVIAKGKNNMALFIRQLAEENFIPTVEDPPTARALYAQVKIGQGIPPELFVAVAKIIASIMRKRQRPTMVPTPAPSLTGFAPVIIEPAPGFEQAMDAVPAAPEEPAPAIPQEEGPDAPEERRTEV